MKRLAEEVRRIVRVKSITPEGNEEVANYTSALLQDRGLKVEVQPVMHSIDGISKRQFNVIGVLGDPLVDRKIKKGLLLLSHLDTVSPGIIKNWTETAGNPFEAQIHDGKIFGLGVADSKLDFLCKLRAIQKYRDRKLKMPIYLVGTCGEELGMFGAKYLIQSHFLNPKYVLVGAPTKLKLAHSHPAVSVFKTQLGFHVIEKDARGFNRKAQMVCYGTAAYSAHPKNGINAILKITQLIEKARKTGFEVRIVELLGGSFVNQVPDQAKAQLFLTSHQFEDFKRFFKELVARDEKQYFQIELGGLGDKGITFWPDDLFGCLLTTANFLERYEREGVFSVNVGKLSQKTGYLEIEAEVRHRAGLEIEVFKDLQSKLFEISKGHPSINFSMNQLRCSPGLVETNNSEWVKICKDIAKESGLSKKTINIADVTEAGLFQKKGYEVLSFGPGQSEGNVHGPNEFVRMDQAYEAVEFYEKLIERVCL